MESPSNTQRLLLRYLLEQVSPEERERIDEALLTDQEFSDSFAEARNDWLDAYVAGSLPEEFKEPVRKALVETAAGASSLAVAVGLRRRRTDVQPIQSNVRRMFPSRAVLAFLAPALAACLLVAVWLRSGPSMRPTRQNSPGSASSSVATVKHVPLPVPAPPTDSAKPSAPAAARQGILALAMPAGTVRGSESVPLALTAAIERVQVQWPLPADETATAYTLAVSRDGVTATKFAQHGPVRTIGTEKIATFVLPAAALPEGEDTFTLYGNGTADGPPVAQFSVAVSGQRSPVRDHGVAQ